MYQGYTPWRRMASGHSLVELIMTKLSKTLLAVTVTGVVSGIILDLGRFKLNSAWTMVLPLGAIAYGLFLISFMLEKEMAKFDADAVKELQLIKAIPVPPVPKA